MIVPLGTDRPLSRPTLVTHILVWANVLIFAAGMTLKQPWGNPELFADLHQRFILNPADLKPWTFLTYAFLHANFMHILGNMLFLWVFGPNVEDRFGRFGFLAFYLLGAAAAAGLHAAFQPNPVLGASGAVAAVTGAYLVLFPKTRINVFFLLVVIGTYQIPAWWFIGGQIVWDFIATGSGRGGRVAVLAHLGGYAFGIGTSMLLLATGILKREGYDLFSLSKQAARRRQFKELEFQRTKAAAAVPDSPVATDELARLRAEVTDAFNRNDRPAATAAYRRLLDRYGPTPVALLTRRTHYELANILFSAGDHQTAATAYRLFLQGYPKDPETPVVRLMLGVINARYLNDPVSAKQDIHEALTGLPDGDHKDLARELLAELG